MLGASISIIISARHFISLSINIHISISTSIDIRIIIFNINSRIGIVLL